MDVGDEEEEWDFFERYRRQRLAFASAYVHYRSLPCHDEDWYIDCKYIWQPGPRDCLYHVVDRAYSSRVAPSDYGFIISTGVCQADLSVYSQQREDIMDSFAETE